MGKIARVRIGYILVGKTHTINRYTALKRLTEHTTCISLVVVVVDKVNLFMLSGKFYCSETACTVSMSLVSWHIDFI
jgi:hypothetical protein